jgi:preprotein translocase subunit YajC
MNIVVLVVLMGALYAFMILPQQRRMKAHTQLVNSLAEGDLVVTNSGIFGAIAEVEDTVVWLEVAPDVELKISKSAIAERISDTDDDDDDDDDDELVDVDADDGDA